MRISDWSSDVCSSDLHDQILDPDQRNPGAVGAHQAIGAVDRQDGAAMRVAGAVAFAEQKSEEHTSELQSLMRISYAVFCLKKKKKKNNKHTYRKHKLTIYKK